MNKTIIMNAYQQRILGNPAILDEHNVSVPNPYSGEMVELTPQAVAVYDILRGCELILRSRYDEETEAVFDAARDVFRATWPEAYMKLVD